jgi:hypothetical protein
VAGRRGGDSGTPRNRSESRRSSYSARLVDSRMISNRLQPSLAAQLHARGIASCVARPTAEIVRVLRAFRELVSGCSHQGALVHSERLGLPRDKRRLLWQELLPRASQVIAIRRCRSPVETPGKALSFAELSAAFESGTECFRPLGKSRLQTPLLRNIKPFSPGSLSRC